MLAVTTVRRTASGKKAIKAEIDANKPLLAAQEELILVGDAADEGIAKGDKKPVEADADYLSELARLAHADISLFVRILTMRAIVCQTEKDVTITIPSGKGKKLPGVGADGKGMVDVRPETFRSHIKFVTRNGAILA